MTIEERIEALEQAGELIHDAIGLIRQATRGSRIEDLARRGVVSHLEMSLSDDHSWLGRNDVTVSDLMASLEEENGNEKALCDSR